MQDSKDQFKKLRALLQKKSSRKATAELEASKNPMKFMKDNKNMSLRGLKGVGF